MSTVVPRIPNPDPNSARGNSPEMPRRDFLRAAGAAVASAGLVGLATGPAAAAQGGPLQPASPNQDDRVQLSQIHAPTDAAEMAPGPFLPPDGRVGFAVVGLGRLSLNQILPAMAKSKYCKPVALVSGSPAKARKIAAQYGIRDSSLYTYDTFDQIARNPEVKVIYIVLPNALHADFVVRGARAGKHILCEKPMATSVADCQRMIAACRTAGVKLMLAYRQQYEPMNRALGRMVAEGKLGTLRSFIASNTQNQGDPTQWRLNRKLAGGGCLPDVGIYCLNAARFLTGEEPSEVTGVTFQPHDDPRFAEVEATCSFTLRFPSGLLATCSTGYGGHHSQFLRLEGADAWAELNPAFGYNGLKLRHSRLVDGQEVTMEPQIEARDQFAEEMDHMALCVLDNLEPHTGGEEGLQDQRLTDAIYESARTGRTVKVAPPDKPTRGAPLPKEA